MVLCLVKFMKKTYCMLIIGIVFYSCIFGFSQIGSLSNLYKSSQESSISPNKNLENLKNFPKESSNGGDLSHYNLSIIFDNSTSSVEGNLTVDFYNNDPINFAKIPFHIYLSGMNFITRPGKVEILNVTKLDNPNIALAYDVYSANQTMWVYLDTALNSSQRVQFVISFNSTIPDGGIDRSNSHGDDYDESRIYKFAGFYPMPCVYDSFDGWNTDPYLHIGDPFYYDMAYYNFFIEAPNDFVIAATGKLEEKFNKGVNIFYHFDPSYPVREVTFSASKWFLVESTLVNGVNLSTYYLPKSQVNWEINALNYGIKSLTLFNDTFGVYPYPTFNIVEEYTEYGGMEYPCQVYIAEDVDSWYNPLYWLEYIIAHETAHQWWYNLIGNDEVDWGFLDEGLACWTTIYYGEIYYGDGLYFQYTPYIDLVRNYYASEGLPSRINASVYEAVDEDNYVFTAYYKAPLILEKLRKTIGNSNFISGLQLFFEQKKYKIALLSDLQQAMEDIYGMSLDWFFFPWFDNPYLPKYNFLSCVYNASENILEIIINDLNEPLNNYGYSQQILLNIYDKSDSIIYSDLVWINSTTLISIPTTITPSKARLLYTSSVIVQLESPDVLYLESQIQIINGEDKEKVISGFVMPIIAIVSVITLIILLFKKLNKR